MAARQRVAVVAFDGIRPFHLSVPCAVFGETSDGAAPPFELRVCAAEPGELRSQAGFGIVAKHSLRALAWADIVVVPSWRDPHEAPPAPLLAALRRAHARGALIVGLCVGAFVLARRPVSSAEKGSSSSISRGRCASARASATRCCCPPESSCGRRR